MIPLPLLSLPQKIAAIAVAMILAAVAGAWAAGKVVNAHWQEKENKRVEAEQAEYTRLGKIAQDLGLALAAETRKRQDDAREWRRKFDDWRNQHDGTVQVDCPAAGLRLVVPDAVHFGADYVDLWNAGLCLGVPAASAACRTDAAPGGTGPVTPASLLANVADNAESCAADRARLRGLQKYMTELSKE